MKKNPSQLLSHSIAGMCMIDTLSELTVYIYMLLLPLFLLRLTMCHTCESSVAPLSHCDIATGQTVVNVRRYQYCHTANLLLHSLSVDLAHVAVLVLYLHIPDIYNQDLEIHCIFTCSSIHLYQVFDTMHLLLDFST